MIRIVLGTVVFLIASTPGFSYEWIDGRNQRCDVACELQGQLGVASGKRMTVWGKNSKPQDPLLEQAARKNKGNMKFTGEQYFVCAAAVSEGEGPRPGYNVAPDWSNACFVGNGGQEVGIPQYVCLCKTRD